MSRLQPLIHKPLPKFSVLARSPRWKSTIERMLGNWQPAAKISWVLDIESGLNEVVSSYSGPFIVELTAKTLVDDCQLMENWFRSNEAVGVFAVADYEVGEMLQRTPDALRLIRVCGIADVCCSLTEWPCFQQRMKRWLKMQPVIDEPIETYVQQNLPWRAIAR